MRRIKNPKVVKILGVLTIICLVLIMIAKMPTSTESNTIQKDQDIKKNTIKINKTLDRLAEKELIKEGYNVRAKGYWEWPAYEGDREYLKSLFEYSIEECVSDGVIRYNKKVENFHTLKKELEDLKYTHHPQGSLYANKEMQPEGI